MDLHRKITIHPRVKSGVIKIFISPLLLLSLMWIASIPHSSINIFPMLVFVIFALPTFYYICSGIWDIISSFRKEAKNISTTVDTATNTTANTHISYLLRLWKIASAISILIMWPAFFMIGTEFLETLWTKDLSGKLELLGPCSIIGILSILFYIFSSKIDITTKIWKLLVYLQISWLVYIIYRTILLLWS
jgi:hypothetical protein